MISLIQMLKDNGISTLMKKRLLGSLVFSMASYGSDIWTLKKSDEKKIEAFEQCCYRKLMRIILLIGNQMNDCWKTWIARKTASNS